MAMLWLSPAQRTDVVDRVRNGDSLATVARHFGTQSRTIAAIVARYEKAEAKRNFALSWEEPRALDDAEWTEMLVALRVRPRWHADAACKEHGDLSWFTARGEPVADQQAICRACLVRQECAAAGADDLFGIWGGTTGRERRRLRVSAA